MFQKRKRICNESVLFVLLIFGSIVLCNTVYASDFRLWYLTNTAVSLPPGFMRVPQAELVKRGHEMIAGDIAGVVVERNVFEGYRGNEITELRSAVLKMRKVVWLTGSEVSLDLLTKRLGFTRHIRREPKTNLIIIADGLYLRSDGVVVGATVYSLERLDLTKSLQEIYRATQAIRHEPQLPSKTEKEDWKFQDGQRDFVPCKQGRFDKYNEVWLLINHQRPLDYWYLKIENTSTPETGFMNKFNEDKNILRNSRELLCHGPEGNVGPDAIAKVCIGCPGPPREWSWETGLTAVKNHSSKQSLIASWTVDFDRNGEEARKKYEWLPGFEADAQKRKEFVLDIKTKLEWTDNKGSVYPTPLIEWPRLIVIPEQ